REIQPILLDHLAYAVADESEEQGGGDGQDAPGFPGQKGRPSPVGADRPNRHGANDPVLQPQSRLGLAKQRTQLAFQRPGLIQGAGADGTLGRMLFQAFPLGGVQSPGQVSRDVFQSPNVVGHGGSRISDSSFAFAGVLRARNDNRTTDQSI